jgi:hypothetical protein
MSGLFNVESLVVLDGRVYERIENVNERSPEASQHKYRVIFSYDDYDYVEDEELIEKLDDEPTL